MRLSVLLDETLLLLITWFRSLVAYIYLTIKSIQSFDFKFMCITFTRFSITFLLFKLATKKHNVHCFPFCFFAVMVNLTPKFHVSMHMYATSNTRRIDGVVYVCGRIPNVFCRSSCYFIFQVIQFRWEIRDYFVLLYIQFFKLMHCGVSTPFPSSSHR